MAFFVKVYTLQEEMPDQTEVTEAQPLSVNRHRAGLDLTLHFSSGLDAQQLTVEDENKSTLFQFPISEELDCCQVGGQSFLMTFREKPSVVLQFKTPSDMKIFQCQLKKKVDQSLREGDKNGGKETETSPSDCYQLVQFHNCLSQQQSLLQDYTRTATYHRAILLNDTDFRDKVVLDVCCGSAILSSFAVQAGAAKVYSVVPGPLSKYTQMLVQSNSAQSDRIRVLKGEVDEVVCPEAVDIIISDPMGYMLLADRLLEKVLFTKKWLKPNGLMFPSWADLHVAPFSDEQLYCEHYARAVFWQQRNFYTINLSALHNAAVDEFFRQPVVDTFDVQILMARSVKHRINLMETTPEDLHRVEIPFTFTLQQSGLVHGLAFWFDVAYHGSKATVWLSTAPSEPLTRLYQVRCLLQTPLFAKLGQTLSGTVLLAANNRQSYDIHITATIDQSGFTSGNVLDLKNPFFN